MDTFLCLLDMTLGLLTTYLYVLLSQGQTAELCFSVEDDMSEVVL